MVARSAGIGHNPGAAYIQGIEAPGTKTDPATFTGQRPAAGSTPTATDHSSEDRDPGHGD